MENEKEELKNNSEDVENNIFFTQGPRLQEVPMCPALRI